MSTRDQLNGYLSRLERRLRMGALLEGGAIVFGAALAATVLLVMLINQWAFSQCSVTAARIALFVVLALAIVLGVALPLVRLNRRRAAHRAEAAFPAFEQRLMTFADKGPGREDDPFVELLAADTLAVAQQSEPSHLAPAARLAGLSAASVSALGVLLWLILAGPGYFGHGASLLWAASPKGGAKAFYDIKVTPGDATVRRKSDQLITAQTFGTTFGKVQLFARYHSTAKWEPVAMQAQKAGTGYEFLFAGLPESVDYYVQAGAVRSPQYTLKATDLPTVRNIKITYRYPAWSGLGEEVVENGGDLRAVDGTEALLDITTDQPLKEGRLVVDLEGTGRKEILLGTEPGKNVYHTTLKIEKNGTYHVAIMDASQPVRISDDFFIEAKAERPPGLKLSRPGKDYKASPIEEVSIQVDADDDYGLRDVTLHYSVNGGPEQTTPLAKAAGQRNVSASAMIALEDHKLVPGDVVSYYATARDAKATTRTDMMFIEAQPFEKEFQQGQQSGGGGGSGQGDQENISQRQKEIIAATFNQIRDKKASDAEAAEAGKFLGEVQAKLKDQATSLARRMQSRELSQQNQEFSSFAKDMTAAAEAMTRASGELKGRKWQDALPHEQKALQHLLRAEATFRQIQVAFGRQGGGGGGGAARDLENLFDLELDTEKNQYETGQQSASEQKAKEVDEALQKLEQLARRQQELAKQQENKQSFEQRWQQEMLRREAEQLQRQMEQLSRNSNQSQQQGQQGQNGQQGQQGGRQQQMDPRVQQALDRLKQATEDMRKAASSRAGQQGQQQQAGNEADARRAAERLKEARDLMGGARRQEAEGTVQELARRAEELEARQQEQYRKMKGAYGNPALLNGQPGGKKEQNEQIGAERGKMADDVARLERDMQTAVRNMMGSERGASNKVREALGEIQQKELQTRLRRSAEFTRRGYGAYAVMQEAPIGQALEQLREKLQEAQGALEGKGLQAGGEGQKEIEQALNRVEKFRQQMEQLGRNGQQQGQGQRGQQQGQQGQEGKQGQQAGERGEGKQPGQGQKGEGQQGKQGQQGQPGGQQGGQQGQGGRGESQQGQQMQAGREGGGGQQGQGQQSASDREARQGGQRGQGEFSAINRGGYLPGVDGNVPQPGQGLAGVEQAFREGMRELNQMSREMGMENPDVAREVQGLIREMQRLDPGRFKGNSELVENLRTQVLANLEQLELQLRRKLDDQTTQVRSNPTRPVPQGYAGSVAEYFRRLSRGAGR
ncbi:MAG: hypothetical protein FJW31_07210 [Acidobacteria bacterium]|nr:hypothetical protein [Acidobacteriota bacterium]